MLTDLSKVQLSDKALLDRILQRFDQLRFERYSIETTIGELIASDRIDLFKLSELNKAKVTNTVLIKEYESLLRIVHEFITNQEIDS